MPGTQCVFKHSQSDVCILLESHLHGASLHLFIHPSLNTSTSVRCDHTGPKISGGCKDNSQNSQNPPDHSRSAGPGPGCAPSGGTLKQCTQLQDIFPSDLMVSQDQKGERERKEEERNKKVILQIKVREGKVHKAVLFLLTRKTRLKKIYLKNLP